MAGQSGSVRASAALIFCLAAQLAYGQAAVEGRVQLPPATKQTVPRVRYAGQMLQPGIPEPPRAVVYLEGTLARTNRPVSERVVLAQTNLQFSASLLPVQLGTEVIFPNQDEVFHNVFSYSKPKRFDLGRYRKDETPPAQIFDRPGLVKLYCEIHEHMRARILVLETPYFTRTDTNGHFRLENVPAGSFQLKAWVDEADIRSQSIELREQTTVRVDFPAHSN